MDVKALQLFPCRALTFLLVREWRDHVQAGVCPTSRRGHTATLVVGRRTVDSNDSLLQTERSFDVANTAAGAGTGRAGADGAANSTGSDPGGGDTRSQVRGEEGHGHNSSGSTTAITPRSPSRATPEQDGQQGLGGRSPTKGGFGGTKKEGSADSIGGRGGSFEDQPLESREMFVIGGAGTDPIRVRAKSYPSVSEGNGGRSYIGW